MHHSTCLNCHSELSGKYCSNCGQSASTHRITLKHFLMHDLLHGIWHLEKGILFTIRQSLIRPGYMALDYVNGKRARYYNFFYLLLMVIGATLLTSHFFNEYYHIEIIPAPVTSRQVNIHEFIRGNDKIFLFALIPFLAFAGKLAFRRLKLNLAEHLILGANVLLTLTLWYFCYNLYYYLIYSFSHDAWRNMAIAMLIVMTLLPIQVYWQATKNKFTLGGFAWRMLCWYLLLTMQLAVASIVSLLLAGKEDIVF